jgi:hypothetical protein
MNKSNINTLKTLLIEFFNSNDLNKRNFWVQNEIGKIMKSNLIKIDKWRARSRNEKTLNKIKQTNLKRKQEREQKKKDKQLLDW